jgi:hypothetical protein
LEAGGGIGHGEMVTKNRGAYGAVHHNPTALNPTAKG